MVWSPRVTVAAVVEEDGRFLIVEEIENGKTVFNQPAGHLEENETLIEAVIRETAEETCTLFEPSSLVGVYQWRNPESRLTFLRFCFSGTISGTLDDGIRDPEIVNVHWLTLAELRQQPLRSPLVLKVVDDFLYGKRTDLSLVSTIPEK